LKRILLFVLTNVMVVAVLGVVASLLGVNRFLTANGLNLTALLGFALVMGFGGAIISLLISKPMAKWTAGVRIINEPQSPDEAWIVQTVRKFADKYDLGFTLLADEDHAVADAYGTWGEKSMYGKTYMGVSRATFIIDGDGRIAKVFPKVSPKTHDDAVLEALGALAG